MDNSQISPTPDTPGKSADFGSSYGFSGTKSADPDLIIENDDTFPSQAMVDLTFQAIGGQEILTVSRHDLINGQRQFYGLISNTRELQLKYSPKNIFKIPGVLEEQFKSFRIKLKNYVPKQGTGPAPYYIGEEDSVVGCTTFPVLDRYDDTLIGCYLTAEEAQIAIDEDLAPSRDVFYSDPLTGNLVADVINMRQDEQVEIEVVLGSNLKNDTIY